MDRSFKFVFKGKVQGVYFRATSRGFANELMLAGQVKNLPDGRVEMYVKGPQERLDALIASLKEQFQIEEIEQEEAPLPEERQNFVIAY